MRGGATVLACEWLAVVALDHQCSGVLVHPELIVYAAHCGLEFAEVAFGDRADRPWRQVATGRCAAHPDASLGSGLDVAFCLLAEPVHDVEPLRIADGCEAEAIRAGHRGLVVAFGQDAEGGEFGIKRSAPVELRSLTGDLRVEASTSGTCAGDSGGALIVPSNRSLGDEPRLIGLVSAAEDAVCGPSVDHYSYLPPLLAWLEDASGRDLTPCFDTDGVWHPTPACTVAQPSEGAWESGCSASRETATLSDRCGAPFVRELLTERTPPSLDLPTVPERSVVSEPGLDFFEMDLEAIARDAESGVAEVRFDVLDAGSVRRASQRDETPPYRIDGLRLPPGSWSIDVTARDHAGNTRLRSLHVRVDEAQGHPGGCALSRGFAQGAGRYALFLVGVGLFRARRRMADRARAKGGRAGAA